MSDEQILATVVGHASECESSDEEDDAQEDEKQVSNSEAVESFKKCLSWMESQINIDPIQIMQLWQMMDFTMQSRCRSLKQTSRLEHLRPLWIH